MWRFIENQLGLTLMLACLLGLVFPFGDIIPSYSIVVLLAIVTFLSCFKINLTKDGIISWHPFLFCLARYAVLPVVLWVLCELFIPDYSLALLLISLLPAGVSSPAFTSMFNGNVALAFAVTMASSVLSILLIPLYIPFVANQTIAVNPVPLFQTLALCLIVPVIVYLLLKKNRYFTLLCGNHGRFISVLLIAVIVFIVIAKERDHILQNPTALVTPVLVALGCYALFFFVGFCWNASYRNRTAYCICSTFNNAALGVGLALIHFGSRVVLVTVAAELLWAILPLLIQPTLRSYARGLSHQGVETDEA